MYSTDLFRTMTDRPYLPLQIYCLPLFILPTSWNAVWSIWTIWRGTPALGLPCGFGQWGISGNRWREQRKWAWDFHFLGSLPAELLVSCYGRLHIFSREPLSPNSGYWFLDDLPFPSFWILVIVPSLCSFSTQSGITPLLLALRYGWHFSLWFPRPYLYCV